MKSEFATPVKKVYLMRVWGGMSTYTPLPTAVPDDLEKMANLL